MQAAVELHRTLGPARTQVSAIAERAGVERVTVYRHFPETRMLLRACAAHNLSLNPLPDPRAWLGVKDPVTRLRIGLTEAFAYYRRNDEMMANVLRDSHIMPVGKAFLEFQASTRETLSRGWRVRGASRARLLAFVALAVDFQTWRLLARQPGLDDAELVATLVELVHCFQGPNLSSAGAGRSADA